MRRLPAVGMVAAGVALTACASAQPEAAPSAPGSEASSAPAGCVASDLSVHGGRQGGGFVGVAHGMVVVTNTTTAACVLAGYPTVALLNQNGTALDIQRQPAPATPKNSIVLAAGQSAGMSFEWANWCSGAPGPLRISIAPYRATGSVVGPFDGPPGYDFVPGCQDSSQPSAIEALSPYAPFTQGG